MQQGEANGLVERAPLGQVCSETIFKGLIETLHATIGLGVIKGFNNHIVMA